jgi:bacteriorhodopsin
MIMASMTTITALSGAACWYFGTQIHRSTPARTALSLLTGFVSSLNLLWLIVYIFSPPDNLVHRLSVAILVVSLLGLTATGLIAALILRREVHRDH